MTKFQTPKLRFWWHCWWFHYFLYVILFTNSRSCSQFYGKSYIYASELYVLNNTPKGYLLVFQQYHGHENSQISCCGSTLLEALPFPCLGCASQTSHQSMTEDGRYSRAKTLLTLKIMVWDFPWTCPKLPQI